MAYFQNVNYSWRIASANDVDCDVGPGEEQCSYLIGEKELDEL